MDPELQKISLEKQNTIKQLEQKSITEEQFKTKISELDIIEKARLRELTATLPCAETTVEIVNPAIPRRKRGRPKKSDRASTNITEKTAPPRKRKYMITEYICKALQMKSVKNVEDVINKIIEWLPEENLKRENLGPQIRVFISAITHKKLKKYDDYKWDKENFTLSKK